MPINTLAQTKPRILYEWGIAPLSDRDRRDLCVLIEDRVGRQANLMTSRQPLGYWQDVMGDHTFCITMHDLLIYHSTGVLAPAAPKAASGPTNMQPTTPQRPRPDP